MRKIDELPTTNCKTEYLNKLITKLQAEADDILATRGDQERYLDLQKQIREAKETKEYHEDVK